MTLQVKKIGFRKAVSGFILLTFLTGQVFTPANVQAQLLPNLPAPGQMVWLTSGFQPPLLRGMTIHPENPLLFDFIVDRGQDKINNDLLKKESTKLIKYFLASMTIPEKEAWVNLSPYEKDRIIPDALGQTEMGRQMLEQDYVLKQLSASLTNPDKELGQKFWNEVKARAQKQFGTTEIPLNTFNKVWIVPDGATVVEKDGFAYITESKLKVMLDEDYVALEKNPSAQPQDQNNKVSKLSSDVFREMILPKLVEEVNTGKNFAQTRQVYQSVILAAWYKKALKDSLLGRIYADKSKVEGVESDVKDIKQKVYDQYLEAFKKGAYSFIKEEDNGEELIPRKYFSGGITYFGETSVNVDRAASSVNAALTQVASSSLNGNFALVAAGGEEASAAAAVAKKIDQIPAASPAKVNQAALVAASAVQEIRIPVTDITTLIDREDSAENGVDTFLIRKIVVKAIQFKDNLDERNLISGLKSNSSMANLYNRMIGENFVVDLGRVIGLIENETNEFGEDIRMAAAALKSLAAASQQGKRTDIEKKIVRLEDGARTGIYHSKNDFARLQSEIAQAVGMAQELGDELLANRARAIPALVKEYADTAQRLNESYGYPISAAQSFLKDFDLQLEGHRNYLFKIGQNIVQWEEGIAQETTDSPTLARIKLEIAELKRSYRSLQDILRGQLSDPVMRTERTALETQQEQALLQALDDPRQPIIEEDWDRRVSFNDWKAVEDIYSVLINSIKQRGSSGYDRNAYAQRLVDIISHWEGHDRQRQEKILTALLIARGWARGNSREAAEWLRRFFRIYHHAFYLSPTAAVSQGNSGAIVFGRIEKVSPVNWEGYQGITYMNATYTNQDGGFKPGTNDHEVVVITNSKAITENRVDPELVGIHEDQHARDILIFALSDKAMPEDWELEYLAYLRTMMEVGKAQMNGSSQNKRKNWTIDHVFGGEELVRYYARSGESAEAHKKAAQKLRASFTGLAMEKDGYSDRKGRITRSFLEEHPYYIEEYWNVIKNGFIGGQNIYDSAKELYNEFYMAKLGFLPHVGNVLDLETHIVPEHLQSQEIKGTIEEVIALEISASSGVDKPVITSAPTAVNKPTVIKDEYGGIDFDPSKLNLQIKRDGHGVPLPLPQQNLENININGLYPVIINIMPINAQTLPILSQLNVQPDLALSKS